ncbi:MAG: phage tail protein [Sphingobium sp.]
MRTLRTVAMIAGAVALVATGVGAAGGAGLLGNTVQAASLAATASSVASVASVVAAAASLGAQLMQKKPGAIGSVNQVTIGSNSPIPYGMGRAFYVGSQVHDAGYGGKVGKTHNPYLSKAFIYSAGGPIEGIESFLADWSPVAGLPTGGSAIGYYAGWLYADFQLGQRPEPTALAGPWGAIPDWSAAHKLSGYGAALVSYKFDRDNKRWANGLPVMGPVGKWARVYDWRQDDTFPGGSGPHRWDDEDTFEWDPNVALNAITYARGRYALDEEGEESVRVVGCGYTFDTIDWPAWTAFANVCEANGWSVNGHVYEGPGISLWDNLKRICAAGAAMPVISGGLLSVRFQSPKVALDTITPADFAEGERVAPGMRTWRDRINTVVPKYRSEANKWEYVQSKAVEIAEYIALDGEPKEEEITYELVTDKDQAAQLAGYELYGRRELTGIVIPCKPRLWEYRLGEALHVYDPENGVDHLCTIVAAEKDIGSATVTFTFETETNAKHAAALAMTGTAPPPPTLIPHGEADGIAWDNAGNAITADATIVTADATIWTADTT